MCSSHQPAEGADSAPPENQSDPRMVPIRVVGEFTQSQLNTALDQIQHLPHIDQAAAFALFHHIQLTINRKLRPVKFELVEWMAREQLRRAGPVELTWTAIDPEYRCNDPDNWNDATTQDQLRAWRQDYPEYVRTIPDHLEIDTRALGEAMANGRADARRLYRKLNELGYRTEEGRRGTLKVRQNK